MNLDYIYAPAITEYRTCIPYVVLMRRDSCKNWQEQKG